MFKFIKAYILLLLAIVFLCTNTYAKEIILSKQGQFSIYTQQELDDLKSQIEKIVTDETQKSVQLTAINKMASLNSKYDALQKDYNSYKYVMEHKAQTLSELQNQLDIAKVKFTIITHDFSKLDNGQLQSKLADLTLEQQGLQAKLAKANSEFLAVQTLPTRAPNIIISNNQKIVALSQNLNAVNLSEIERDSILFEIYTLEKENSFLQEKLLSQAVLEDMETYKLKILNLENDYLSDYILQIKSYQSDIANKNLTLDNSEVYLANNKVFANELQINEKLVAYVEQRQNDNLKLSIEQKKVEESLNTVKQIQNNLNNQLDAITGSIVLSRLLNRQQAEIPAIHLDYKLDELIPDLNIWIYDVRRYRENIFDVNSYVDNLIAKDASLEDYRSDLETLINKRRDLYDELYSGLSTALTIAIDLKAKYEQYSAIRNRVNSAISDHLFWIASNQGLGVNFVTSFYPLLKIQVSSFVTNLKNPTYWTANITTLLTILSSIIILSIIIKSISSKLTRFDNKLALKLDKEQDRYWVTPLAFFNKFILVIPKVSWVIAIGAIVIYVALDNSAHQVQVTLMFALHVTIFIFYLELLKPNSIAQRHFSYSPSKLSSLRLIVDKVYWLIIPILIVANIKEINPINISDDVIGYCIVLLFLCALTYVIFNYIKYKLSSSEVNLLGIVVYFIYIAVPVTLLIMLALGYYYTVVKLINRIAFSFYLCLGYVFISNIIRRILYVAELKLVTKARLNKNKFEEKQKSSALDSLRLELINVKAYKLINIILLCITGFFLYLQWQDLAGVLSYLDTIHIFTSSSIVDGKEVISNVLTLADVITAIFILLVATILNKNLPALLERLFLLKQTVVYKSTSYTVRIISSYIITTLGIIFAAGALGISWSNLQWLVAALSVGLGFGLQEIFANFVSGIIILFERQIRVGDIITLNNLSGTVKRIRIRAITIVSFDNKEVVIPNRQFITTALTNWSLSNTITKLDFIVGVAYDADVQKAKKILNDIVRRCENLSTEHNYKIFISSLDASCVTITCEVFVKEIGLRKPTYDYLSTKTLERFAKEGIEIPFNQLDVKIKNLDTGKELAAKDVKA